MGWSADFIWALSQPSPSLKFAVEFTTDKHAEFLGSGGVSSHGNSARIMGNEVAIGSGRVQVGSWRFTKGGWSVLLVDDGSAVYDALANTTRGVYVELLAGFAGWSVADFEPIAIGALVNVSGVLPELRLECSSLLTHWATRHSVSTAKLALFDDIDLDDADRTRVTTSVDGAYSIGDGTLTVVSTALFNAGDSKGAILCHDPTEGDPFFLTYTGTTATTFTGCSGSDLHSTVRTDMTVADGNVWACAYLEGHPFDIARQVLVSTGTSGAHGDYDDLPEEWGFAAYPRWVDDDDIDEWKAVVGNKSGTDHDWSVIVETAQVNAIGWLSALLAEAGIWLVERQGAITLRCAQNPDATSSNKYHAPLRSGIHITDADIEEVIGYQLWATDVAAEAAQTVAWYNSGHSSATTPDSVTVSDLYVATLPGYTNADHDLLDVVWQSSVDPATDVAYRCHVWETRVPEYARIRCRGLRLAQLCPGDLVEVTSSHLQGRLDTTFGGWDGVDALVIGVSTRWMDGTVELELVVPSLKYAS